MWTSKCGHVGRLFRSLSQIKTLHQHLQHQQNLAVSAFQSHEHDDGHQQRGTYKKNTTTVPIAYLAFLLFFKADCLSDCDHLVYVGEGDDGCRDHGNKGKNDNLSNLMVKLEHACRKCPTILSPVAPPAPVPVPPPALVPQLKKCEADNPKEIENENETLPTTCEEKSPPTPEPALVPASKVVKPPLRVELAVEEKEENYEIKSLEIQNPSGKITVDKDGDYINGVLCSTSSANASKSTYEETNADKGVLSRVLKCLGFQPTKMEEIASEPPSCPVSFEEHLIIKEEVPVHLEKIPKFNERTVVEEKRPEVMVDKYKNIDNENGNVSRTVNRNDCGSNSLLTRLLKPFNYCFSLGDFSKNEDYSSYTYTPPIYPPNCECKPPLKCLRDAQDLSHKYLIKQANVLSLDSINRILSETISTLQDLHIEYRVMLRNLYDLLNERLVHTTGVHSELLDCNIVYLRGRIEEHSKSIEELDCYLAQVLNLVDCAAEVASCGGADLASACFCEQYSTMLYQIEAIKTETRSVENNLADFQKSFYVQSGQALI